ncbi:hypothetical protein [Paraflavitalea sp. CAU 1676]|uniref:hypothetical protein n=1 Tax=Paraflavitalea sp. CAU 1676 TaxID=3032598 RepID=UPI0023DADEE6|nr:hypothetical protein [Paraflavitalea sp. CAU 1676]MDF2189258.1 hypothetical protein [Paraflavitalea sp. CAU 1676]
MKKLVLSIVIALIAGSIWAQDNPAPKSPTARKDKKAAKREQVAKLMKMEEEGEIIFNKQGIFGIKLSTDGYGLSYEWGRFKSNRVANIFQIELNEKKHPKEKRTSYAVGAFNVNSVVYGKTNNFYQLKFGMGQQRIIGGKGNKNGVAVMAAYAGGVSLGFQKPYLVDVEGKNRERLRSSYPTIIDSSYLVIGAAGFTTGWNEVELRPGAHAKAGLRFDFGRFNETVTAVEVGVNAEYYPQKVSQMAYNKEKTFFFCGYVTLLLGRRK